MTPEEFTEAIKALGMDNSSMARWIGRSRRTVQRYQYPLDDPRSSPIKPPLVRLIRHWLKERGIDTPE